ncbi:hypothetical protein B0H14DRAFT_2631883 [Mycena olivaceomarginata]|nr:hypothetical protein B0H14DRAFT_2631883 [Mycena olivaceomarginata]
MWLRIADVFDVKEGEVKEGQDKDVDKQKRNDPDERKKKREGNQKVIDALRKVFDDAGHPTVDGYRLGESAQAVIVLAYPAHVDAVLRAKAIEIERPFEIAVRGFAAYPESRARQVCDGWFYSFRRPDGSTLLAETRAGDDVDERDYMFYTMADWATTELVLGAKSCESFIKATAAFHLHPLQLLYNVNSAAAWKTRDAATAIDEGAKKIDSGLTSIARRMEVLERQAQSRHDATEARMGLLETTLTTAVASIGNIVGRVEELGRGFHFGQQHTHLTIDLLRIDNDMTMARHTIAHPIDDDDKAEAVAECKRLKVARADVQAKLDALCGNTNSLIVAPPGPTIAPPPLPPRSSTPTPGPSNKRPPHLHQRTRAPPAPSSSASAMEVDDEGSLSDGGSSPPPRRFDDAKTAFNAPLHQRCRTVYCNPLPPECAIFLAALFIFTSVLQVAAAVSVPFSIYALNSNGLMDSVKLHHINIAISARNPHAFVLSESKDNSKTGPNLPNDDYNIFEEPGVQSDNFHTYKWGVAVGIRKNIQIAQRVAINAASLRGRVVAVDIVLPTTTGQGFVHRMIGAYAPWDPGTPDTCEFWPDLTALVNSTTTSWSVAGDLNATVSASERASGGANARSQFIKFLNDVDAVDIWSNNPERNRHRDWTSRAGVGAPSGNIIDRIVTSR